MVEAVAGGECWFACMRADANDKRKDARVLGVLHAAKQGNGPDASAGSNRWRTTLGHRQISTAGGCHGCSDATLNNCLPHAPGPATQNRHCRRLTLSFQIILHHCLIDAPGPTHPEPPCWGCYTVQKEGGEQAVEAVQEGVAQLQERAGSALWGPVEPAHILGFIEALEIGR